MPTNWEDLVTKSAKSATSIDIDSFEIWFSQHYFDLQDLTSGFDSTFRKGSNTVTPPTITPYINEVIIDIDAFINDVTGSYEVPGSITPPIVSLDRNTASEGDLLTPDTPNAVSEGDICSPRNYKNSRVKVRFKDSGTLMSRFTNLCESGLIRSKRLQQGKLTYDGDGIVYNLITNFSAKSPMPLEVPALLFERALCAQDKYS